MGSSAVVRIRILARAPFFALLEVRAQRLRRVFIAMVRMAGPSAVFGTRAGMGQPLRLVAISAAPARRRGVSRATIHRGGRYCDFPGGVPDCDGAFAAA